MEAIITFDEFGVERQESRKEVEVLMLKGEKGDPGVPTDAQVTAAVNTWLEAHPEAMLNVSVVGKTLVIGGQTNG